MGISLDPKVDLSGRLRLINVWNYVEFGARKREIYLPSDALISRTLSCTLRPCILIHVSDAATQVALALVAERRHNHSLHNSSIIKGVLNKEYLRRLNSKSIKGYKRRGAHKSHYTRIGAKMCRETLEK